MYWECDNCSGRLATLPVLKKALHADTIQELWQQAFQLQLPALLPCPACEGRMEEVPVRTPAGDIMLDVCTTCQFVWMDAGEIDHLPKVEPVKVEAANVSMDDVPDEVKLAIAQQKSDARAHKVNKELWDHRAKQWRNRMLWRYLGF